MDLQHLAHNLPSIAELAKNDANRVMVVIAIFSTIVAPVMRVWKRTQKSLKRKSSKEIDNALKLVTELLKSIRESNVERIFEETIIQFVGKLNKCEELLDNIQNNPTHFRFRPFMNFSPWIGDINELKVILYKAVEDKEKGIRFPKHSFKNKIKIMIAQLSTLTSKPN